MAFRFELASITRSAILVAAGAVILSLTAHLYQPRLSTGVLLHSTVGNLPSLYSTAPRNQRRTRQGILINGNGNGGGSGRRMAEEVENGEGENSSSSAASAAAAAAATSSESSPWESAYYVLRPVPNLDELRMFVVAEDIASKGQHHRNATVKMYRRKLSPLIEPHLTASSSQSSSSSSLPSDSIISTLSEWWNSDMFADGLAEFVERILDKMMRWLLGIPSGQSRPVSRKMRRPTGKDETDNGWELISVERLGGPLDKIKTDLSNPNSTQLAVVYTQFENEQQQYRLRLYNMSAPVVPIRNNGTSVWQSPCAKDEPSTLDPKQPSASEMYIQPEFVRCSHNGLQPVWRDFALPGTTPITDITVRGNTVIYLRTYDSVGFRTLRIPDVDGDANEQSVLSSRPGYHKPSTPASGAMHSRSTTFQLPTGRRDGSFKALSISASYIRSHTITTLGRLFENATSTVIATPGPPEPERWSMRTAYGLGINPDQRIPLAGDSISNPIVRSSEMTSAVLIPYSNMLITFDTELHGRLADMADYDELDNNNSTNPTVSETDKYVFAEHLVMNDVQLPIAAELYDDPIISNVVLSPYGSVIIAETHDNQAVVYRRRNIEPSSNPRVFDGRNLAQPTGPQPWPRRYDVASSRKTKIVDNLSSNSQPEWKPVGLINTKQDLTYMVQLSSASEYMYGFEVLDTGRSGGLARHSHRIPIDLKATALLDVVVSGTNGSQEMKTTVPVYLAVYGDGSLNIWDISCPRMENGWQALVREQWVVVGFMLGIIMYFAISELQMWLPRS
ncbi:hypothetical protein GQ42DRAFT_164591, partial [Ramicandelaber brevisporus]